MPLPQILQPKEDDIQKMLTAQVHIGTRNSENKMNEYIWKRRQDGIHVLNLGQTWEKLILAARIIVAIENPQDVVAISARPYGQRAVLKFAQYTGAQCIAGRFTPGTFTNQITKQFREPRLLIVTDPRTDSQAVKEASYVNVPVIAFCDSDSPLPNVDVAIPANNKGKYSIGLLFWLLAREVLRMRGTIQREGAWDVPVDLFFYRDTEELEKADEAQAPEQEAPAGWGSPPVASEMAPIDYVSPTEGISNFDAPPPAAGGGWDAAAPEPAAAGGGWDAPAAAAGASSGWDQPAAASGW